MRRVAAATALVLALGGCSPSSSSAPEAAGATREIGRPCERYTLIGRVRVPAATAFARPTPQSDVVSRFPRINEQGADQVFPLVDHAYGAGRVWYEAMLPVRPNGTTGWIAANELKLQRSDYRLRVDLERLRVLVYDLCRRIASYPIGIGTKDTPTPRGTFFLNSLLKPPAPGSVYGAFAFGLSAYSHVIRDWQGGGIVGLHGTNDPSSIGHEVSHGCIRMRNEDIRALVRILPLGTIVQIH